ncbi:Digalactosyldiacylglycerol synthase 1, chloroplastic [Morella rubra]|uniref:Digalactosyldiacylglycerol synthase 1, chloroplastic n=1 Tax=Morella rubra TaxID=262757 RepID=A0A6A1WKM9_9ROSI|nr:Digalactosyldiacylglycerol synthase 1, chloroplastic [Morella rubra]
MSHYWFHGLVNQIRNWFIQTILLLVHQKSRKALYVAGLRKRIGFKADFKISFYPGKFAKERRSIIPAGGTSQFIPSKDADIAILEEPEHLYESLSMEIIVLTAKGACAIEYSILSELLSLS